MHLKTTIGLVLLPANSAFANTEAISNDFAWLILYVSLALGFSFLCSIAEAVLLSITPSYIEGLKEKKPKLAALIKRLKQDNIDQSLAAILTLNTIAHTVGAIGAGAKASIIFGSAWFGFFSAIMTLMILFLSEIIPKTIGAVYWSKLVRPTAIFVQFLILILYPIVWVSERLTRLVSGGKKLHIFSHEEFMAMARVGEKSGHIEDNETRIIRNLFKLRSLKTTDIMTPRTVISAFSEEMTVKDALEPVTNSPFSRLPVYSTNFDDITGFVLKDDILLTHAQNQSHKKLKSLKRDIHVVPSSASLSTLLEHLLKDRQHIAIVVDEYGGTTGIVALEDLVETLMGIEIVDETDNVEDMQALARRKWVERVKALGIEHEFAQADEKENTEE